MNDFYVTRDLFRNYTSYDADQPLTFDEWNALPREHKSAVLYLQYFDQITLAWYKCKNEWTHEEDGVSEVLMYLNKNVAKIEADPKRFKPSYIYKVAWNCLSCLGWDDPTYSVRKRRYDNERTNIVKSSDGKELNLFDTVEARFDDLFDELHDIGAKQKFWEIIEDQDADTIEVVARLIGDHSQRRRRVPEEKVEEIIENLRTVLADVAECFEF